MMIQGLDKLQKRFKHGRELLHLAEIALQRLQPATLMQHAVQLRGDTLTVQGKRYDLKRYQNIYVVGAGKATYRMAEALVKLLGKRVTAGSINVPVAYKPRLGNVVVTQATHPFPDPATVTGSRTILNLVQQATANDLVICLISGGGSSMLALPRPGITLSAKVKLTKQLMHASADIIELNTVRKHLSATKGGQLAAATKAQVISLVISDVFGDQLDVIASGPTVPDASTIADALRVLDKYKLGNAEIRRCIAQEETPKQLDPKRVHTVVIGNNQVALELIATTAKRQGIKPIILTSFLRGEAKEAAQVITSIAREVETYHRPAKAPVILLAGGETTVQVLGKGHGGRNQEFVLAAVPFLSHRMSVLSLATDGVDGVTPTPVAGALADGQVADHCVLHGINYHDYLYSNDSFTCLKQLGCLLHTGPTGTNVGDIVMLLIQ